MPTNISRIGIVDLAELLEDRKKNNQKIALILGSRTGALSRSQKLINEMSHYTTLPLATMEETDQFSECYPLLKVAKKRTNREDLGILLKEQIKGIDFSIADDFMADLVKQKIFRVIINSNIDNILYEALIESKLEEHDDFTYFDIGQCIITESVDEIIHYPKKNPCKIINLYNDVDTFVYGLDQPTEQEDISRYVKKLLERMRVNEVLVLGMDLKWDNVILSALPPRIKTVLLVNEDEQEDKRMQEAFCSSYERLEQFSFIIGRQWGYERVLRALYLLISPNALPLRHEFTVELQNQIRLMQRDLTGVREKLADLEKEVKRTQQQIKGLSRKVEGAIKSNTDEEA